MKTHKKWLIGLGLAVGSVLIEACLSPLRRIDLTMTGIIGMLIFATFTYCCLRFIKNLKPQIILIAITGGLLILHLSMRIPWWRESLISLPDALIHFIGIGLGYFFWWASKKIKLSVVIPLTVIIILCYIPFYNSYLYKLHYDTWTGYVDSTTKSAIMFKTSEDEQKSLENFKGEYLLIDFWYTRCPQCYRAMPDVQDIYDEYKETPGVNVISIHCHSDKYDENTVTGRQILKDNDYTFPCLAMNIEDPSLAEVGVLRYPTVLIFNPDSELVFRGNIKDAGKYLERIMESQ